MGTNTLGVIQEYSTVPSGPNAGKPSYTDAQIPANTLIGNNTGSTSNPVYLSVAQVLTMLGVLNTGTDDKFFTQPSAGTSWTVVHGNSYRPANVVLDPSFKRIYPIEDHSVAGQITYTLAVSQVHTSLVIGRGSVGLRTDKVISVLASAVNTASGVIDIATARTVIITMDANIPTLTFVGTPVDSTELKIVFIKGASLYTCVLDTNKFQPSTTNIIPSPLLLATANTRDTFSFMFNITTGKMALVGFDLGA